jgi:hypothetical protein
MHGCCWRGECTLVSHDSCHPGDMFKPSTLDPKPQHPAHMLALLLLPTRWRRLSRLRLLPKRRPRRSRCGRLLPSGSRARCVCLSGFVRAWDRNVCVPAVLAAQGVPVSGSPAALVGQRVSPIQCALRRCCRRPLRARPDLTLLSVCADLLHVCVSRLMLLVLLGAPLDQPHWVATGPRPVRCMCTGSGRAWL